MNDEAVKEIIYEFETCNPKSSYIKPLYGKNSRKFVWPLRITTLIIYIECLLIKPLDHSSSSFIWWIPPFLGIISAVLNCIVLPHNRKKIYQKIHAAGEDCYHYTFYNDSVRIKNPNIEAILAYDTAEYYAENSERLMIIFPFNRTVSINKNQCDEKQLAFFRNIVAVDNQKKVEKKTTRKGIICLSVNILEIVILAVILGIYIRADKNYYVSDYQCTTYVSFEDCLDAGTIDDVVIIKDKYVEYTYTGRNQDERYYTICPDDINDLIEKLEDNDVDWEKE